MSDTPRQRTAARDHTTETAPSKSTTRTCLECASSTLVHSEAMGELVYDDCGLVLEAEQIDRGPE